jgi:hypothetical protein
MDDYASQLKRELEEERRRLYLEKYAPEHIERTKNKDLSSFAQQ